MAYRLIVVLVFGCMIGTCLQAAQFGADGLFVKPSSTPLLGAPIGATQDGEGQGQDEAEVTPVKLFVTEKDADKKEREERGGIDFFLDNEVIQLLLKDIYRLNHHDLLSDCYVDQKKVNRFYLENKEKVLEEAIWIAVNTDNIQAVEILCDHTTVNVNGLFWDFSYLMIAANKGNWDMVNLLRKRGAYIKCCDVEKFLKYAIAEKSPPDFIRELLCIDIDLNKLGNEGTFLMKAATHGNVDAIRVLCDDKRVVIDTQDGCGNTALMCAACCGHREAVEILLEKNARLDIHDADGDNALVFAVQGGAWDIVDLLRKKGAQVEECSAEILLAFAVEKGRSGIAFVKEVLDLYPSLDLNKPLSSSGRYNGYTFLMVAAEASNKEAVKILLDAGVDVNIGNEKYVGATALDYAILARRNHEKLSCGLDLEAIRNSEEIISQLEVAAQKKASSWSLSSSTVAVSVALSVLLAVGVYIFWDKIGLKRV